MNESHIVISPHGGIDTRFPEHKIVSGESGIQKVRKLHNLIDLDGRVQIVPGATRFDAADKGGNCSWMKRIYYQDSFNDKKFLFAVINNKLWKGNEATQTFGQVKINNSHDISLTANVYPISATLKSTSALATYLVDGTYFYKFLPNDDGEWDLVNTLQDIDGNTIFPIYNCEWLDRHWVLVKGRNVLLGSANLKNEIFNDATDSVLLQLPPGNGGYPRALIKYRGLLWVFHDDYFAPVTGTSASTFGIRPNDIVEGYGCNAGRSVCLYNNKIGFLNSRDNEYYLTSGTFDSTDSTPLSYDIKLAERIDPIKVGDAVAHYDTALKALRIAYWPSGGTGLNNEEIHSLVEDKWCGQTRDRFISCYAQWNGIGDDHRLCTGRSDMGVVMVNDRSINFDGNAIHYKFESASYMPADPFDVQFEEFYVDLNPKGNSSLSISYYIDSRITTVGQDNVNQQGEGINLGLITIADQSVFTNRSVPIIDRSKGRMIRFQIEATTLNSLLELFGFYCFYNKQETKFSKYVGGAS